MSRKPTDPRPDRRYVPVAIDTTLDRIRSASAVIAPPGFAFLPGNLNALFADAVRELRAQAGSASPQSQSAERFDGSPILPDRTALAPETSGGFRPVGPSIGDTTGTDSFATSSISTVAFAGVDTSEEGIRPTKAASTAAGGGALPGRGSGGGSMGRPQPSSGGTQPLSGQSGPASFFGAGFASGAAGTSAAGAGGAANSNAANAPGSQTPVGLPTQPGASAQSSTPAPSSGLPAKPSQPNPANQPAANPALQNSAAARNGLGTLAGLAGGSSSSTSFSAGEPGNVSSTSDPFTASTTPPGPSPSSSTTASASPNRSLAPLSSSPAIPSTSGESSGASGVLGSAAAMVAPVGGGNGGIFAQAWRYQQSPPTSAPYSSGPVAGSTAAAPFNTLNSLILSYIDSALSSFVPTNTSGSNVATTPAGLTTTSTDGLGTYTFSAGASYDIDGTYVGGGGKALSRRSCSECAETFSTTDCATFSYSFHEVGYTPDGNQFTLNDSGGATANVHADDGNTATHSLTNTLAGSDSYALIQVLNQSDAVGGSYTSTESDSESVGGSESFTLNETQTEAVNTSGSITGGSDTYSFSESGNDTSSLSDIGGDSVSGISGVQEADGSSSSGAGSGGHTLNATGADTMATLGFLSSGSNQFTWAESDSESDTTVESDSDTVSGGGDAETDSATEADTQSESETNGETGSENYSDSEGTNFGWTETVGYAVNGHDVGSDQGTETEGTTDNDTDGGGEDDGNDESVSTTDGDSSSGDVTSTLTVSGSQTLSDGIIQRAGASFTWAQHASDTDTYSETDTDSDGRSDTGSDIESVDTVSYSDGESDSDSSSESDTQTGNSNETDTGNESLAEYGLISSGADAVTIGRWDH